jgi:hypothetical protein
VCGETPAKRYEDYFRHSALACWGGLLVNVLSSADLKPAVERAQLRIVRPLSFRDN